MQPAAGGWAGFQSPEQRAEMGQADLTPQRIDKMRDAHPAHGRHGQAHGRDQGSALTPSSKVFDAEHSSARSRHGGGHHGGARLQLICWTSASALTLNAKGPIVWPFVGCRSTEWRHADQHPVQPERKDAHGNARKAPSPRWRGWSRGIEVFTAVTPMGHCKQRDGPDQKAEQNNRPACH
jgi:hypothetical protein